MMYVKNTSSDHLYFVTQTKNQESEKTRIKKEREEDGCEICQKVMLRRSIARHMRTVHGKKEEKYYNNAEERDMKKIKEDTRSQNKY